MDCLVGYGSDDDNDERVENQESTVASRRPRDDGDNYDAVNMDMSEDSGESEPELPPATAAPSTREDKRKNSDSRAEGDRKRDERPAASDERRRSRDDERRGGERRRRDRSHERRARPDDRRSDKDRHRRGDPKRPMERPAEDRAAKAEPRPEACSDTRDAASPRFRERRERPRRADEGRERHRHPDRRSRSRDRAKAAAFPPAQGPSSSTDRRNSPSGDYRHTSYKVNKKLEVMEKMGLQIKTPDGSMATAQQLRRAASDGTGAQPPLFGPAGTRLLDQKRKLLWGSKSKSEAEEAAKWSGTRFAQDADGRQANKFMRLMGIKEPAAVAQPAETGADPIKKQEELFQAMQQQYEAARAATHTMRGVGLGFQRGQF